MRDINWSNILKTQIFQRMYISLVADDKTAAGRRCSACVVLSIVFQMYFGYMSLQTSTQLAAPLRQNICGIGGS
jgi:hypothetical protein